MGGLGFSQPYGNGGEICFLLVPSAKRVQGCADVSALFLEEKSRFALLQCYALFSAACFSFTTT
jgi:hypothetical protein